MSLRFAILGLLTYEPMSGYTLKTRYFDRSIAHFWPADQAQIYRTLQRLEAGGEVVSKTVPNSSRPDSKVYAITPAGTDALIDWLGRTQPLTTSKEDFLVQLYFGRLLSRSQMIAVLQSRRAEHQKNLKYFQTLEIPPGDSPMMRRQVVFGGMTLDFARRREGMMVEWLDACIETVAALPDAPHPAQGE